MDTNKIKTLGQLKKAGWQSKGIKDELRDNLIKKIEKGEVVFNEIHGYEDTVLPDLERAILSRHNILLLGLRGQAKTKIARLLTNLLDEYMPVIEGTEIYEDPLKPITSEGREIVEQLGDKTPIKWVGREDRYVEKLATPDVSVSDLIGDIDPIKAAAMKLPYSDPRVIHYGLVPHAHRCIFVLNELPDLQARIQVSLFNILQEEDIQIRGFKIRLPLDIEMVFTANPEDYTNRGSIITPLKDRIESQILTHYPLSLEIASQITNQEKNLTSQQESKVSVPPLVHRILERISFEARENDLVDEKSGVSARLSISAFENLVSAVERRILKNGEKSGTARLGDLMSVMPSIVGKVELVYEGERMGPFAVALELINDAIVSEFLEVFPHPDDTENADDDPYRNVRAWFNLGNVVELGLEDKEKDYNKKLDKISGMNKLLESLEIEKDKDLYKEFVLFAFAKLDILSKEPLGTGFSFRDVLANMFDDLNL